MPHAGQRLTLQLRSALKEAIKKGLSPRHVPRFVVEVGEVPVTVNGKKVEGAVRSILGGGSVGMGGVANPGCLGAFERFKDVESDEVESDGVRAKL